MFTFCQIYTRIIILWGCIEPASVCDACADVADSEVEATIHEIKAAGYDCFKTSLGGQGVTASIVNDINDHLPSS